MTSVPRSSTSTSSTTAAALLAARHREAHVEEVAEREQPVARRLDAAVGGVDGVAGREPQHGQLADDERGLRLAVAGDPHLLDDVARAEVRVGEGGVVRRRGGVNRAGGRAGRTAVVRLGGLRAGAGEENGHGDEGTGGPGRSSPQHNPTAEIKM